jgi:hypothetical protein
VTRPTKRPRKLTKEKADAVSRKAVMVQGNPKDSDWSIEIPPPDRALPGRGKRGPL